MRRAAKLVLAALLCSTAVLPQSRRDTNPAPYSVVHGWPILPEGFALGQVSGVGIDSENHVWIFQRGDHSWPAGGVQPRTEIKDAPVLCFDGDTGKLLARWGENRFITPHGLRVDSGNHIWLTDLGLQQVFKFDRAGNLLLTIGERAIPGNDGRHFNGPADVAIAPDGSIYVADGYGNSRVAHFASDGRFLGEWGTPGDGPSQFNVPHGIVVDVAGRVYVADRQNARIQVFSPQGEFIEQWKSDELGRPWSLTLGPDGAFYVVDGGDMKPWPPDRGRILKLSRSGKVLARWSSFGNYDGQIYWGHDIAVGRDGAVYVGDVFHGMRIQKFVRSHAGGSP